MRDVNIIKQAVAKSVLSVVVLSTPVGMPETWLSPPPPGYQPGHARFSWRTNLNTALGTDMPGIDPGGAATIAHGIGVIRRSKFRDTIYLTNAAPYIVRLDEGWSRQQRAGFVDRSIRGGLAALNQTTQEIP